MIQIESLFQDLAKRQLVKQLEPGDEGLEQAAAAAIRGDYEQAGTLAAQRFEEDVFDARLLGYLLYGAELERGPSCLELLLSTVRRVIQEGRTSFGPGKRRDVLLDGSINWFLSRVVSQIERAEQLRDESWQKWQGAALRGELDGVLPVAEQLQPILHSLGAKPRAPTALLHLIDLLQQLGQAAADLRAAESATSQGDPNFSSAATLAVVLPAATQPSEPQQTAVAAPDSTTERVLEPEPPEQEVDRESAARPIDEPLSTGPQPQLQVPESRIPEPLPTPSASSPQIVVPGPPRRLWPGFATPSTIAAGAALQDLARTIELFVSLVDSDEALHAAVVAAQIQQTIDSFDPRVYLPALLAPYFRGLSQRSAQLAPILERREQLAFRALTQLYQVDPSSFVEAAAQPKARRPAGQAGHDDDEDE